MCDLEKFNSMVAWVRLGLLCQRKRMNIADIDTKDNVFYKYAMLISVVCFTLLLRLYVSEAFNIRKNMFGIFVCRLIQWCLAERKMGQHLPHLLSLATRSVTRMQLAPYWNVCCTSQSDFQQRSLNRVFLWRREGGREEWLTARFDRSQTARL
jgi:hypothetical protein